jgi:hypothetical protein
MTGNDVVVGFIGLGIMGGRMAANLQKAGYKLVVHDLHRQAASHQGILRPCATIAPRFALRSIAPIHRRPCNVRFRWGNLGQKINQSEQLESCELATRFSWQCAMG